MKDMFGKEIKVNDTIIVSVACGNGHGLSIGPVVKVSDKTVWWIEKRVGAYDAWDPIEAASGEKRWASVGNRMLIYRENSGFL